jgi:hypothetical protein
MRRGGGGPWLPEEIRSAVIAVQTGIHTGCFMAKTILDSGRVPQGESRNDDEQIAWTTMKRPCESPCQQALKGRSVNARNEIILVRR